jgi:type I restriction enzyme S subunit
MTSKWDEVTLESLKAITKSAFAMGPFGSNIKAENFKTIGVPVIKGGNLREGTYLDESKFDYLTQEKADQLSSSKARRLDLVITHRGTLGQVGLIPETSRYSEYVVSQSQLKMSFNLALVDPYFVYYFLNSSLGQIRLLANTSQVGVPAIAQALTTIRQLKISIPDLFLQKKITEFLRLLDDRITLLRETNKTLEAIAQAIFKSWFVDFDPVRAKQEGRLPEGMDSETAKFFPDSFEQSKLGMIPKGWVINDVSLISEIVKGKSYSSQDLVDRHSTALVTLKSFERGGGFRMDGFKPYSGAYKPSQIVRAGDLIVAYTDVTQAAELIGRPAIVVEVEEYETLVASLDVGIIRPNIEFCGRQFLFGLFNTNSFKNHTLAHTSGTTVLHLSKDGIGSFRFALPPKKIIDHFELTASVIAERKQININQIRTLSSLKDILLPRLISGQLSLPDAEKQVKAAIA